MTSILNASSPALSRSELPLRGRPAWAEVDLDAVADNVRAISALVGSRVGIIAVVKANGYGLGAVPVALAAHAAGAVAVAVSCVDEGIELRQAGLGCPIMVLGYSPAWEAERVVVNQLTPTVGTIQLALALSSIATELGIQQPVQVKLDTGMSRLGLLPEQALPFLELLAGLPGLRLAGLFTHFARADESDKQDTLRQLAQFERLLGQVEQAGHQIPLRHAANTAATLDLPETHFDAVRIGIGLIGLYPTAAVAQRLPLRPAVQLKARLARLERLAAGTSVGYGGTHRLERDAEVGLIPMGYADGLPLSLSNRGSALIGGRRVPIVGRVSMDMTTVLLDNVPAALDDEVVLLGEQLGTTITAEELAEAAGTLHYEIVTRIPPRLPRIYLRGGRPVQMQTLLGARQLSPSD